MRPGRLRGISIGVLALVALALPGAAQAETLEVAAATTGPIKANGLISATAKCPAGHKVVSGGWAALDEVYPYVSRDKKGKAWTASLEPEDPTDPATVFAYCSDEISVKVAEKKTTLKGDSGRRTNITARCPKGKQAAAGGYEILKPKNNKHEGVFFDSYRKGSSKWRVSAFNENDKKAKAKSIAYCVGGKPVTSVAMESSSFGSGANNDVSASCAAGDDALGGGYKTSPKPDYENTDGPDLFFNELSLDPGAGTWTAAAHNYSVAPGTLTVFAYCR